MLKLVQKWFGSYEYFKISFWPLRLMMPTEVKGHVAQKVTTQKNLAYFEAYDNHLVMVLSSFAILIIALND